jgi:hypothetical protein
MKIKVQVVIESDRGDTKVVENIACLERATLRPEELGLTLAEAKELLESVQRNLVEQQVAEYLEQQTHCPCCGKKRLRKGEHSPLVYRTLFGKLRLSSVRFFHCGCQPHATLTFSPLAQLLTERTAPELLYLETKFASLMSYGLTVDILQEVLPLGKTINAATVRSNAHAVGRRIDKELGKERMGFIDGSEFDWEQLPRPGLPLTVGLDGGYVQLRFSKMPRHKAIQCITALGQKRIQADYLLPIEAPSRFASNLRCQIGTSSIQLIDIVIFYQ